MQKTIKSLIKSKRGLADFAQGYFPRGYAGKNYQSPRSTWVAIFELRKFISKFRNTN